MSTPDLQNIAQQVVELARSLGAEEVTASAGTGSWTELSRRNGRVEQAKESRSLSVGASIMVDGRFSSHSTSDLRPDALRAFIERAVVATRFLEPDPNRAMLTAEEMGLADVDLDQDDPHWNELDPDGRAAWCNQLEEEVREKSADDPVRSITAYIWDGRSEAVVVRSNGHSVATQGTSYGHAATVSLADTDGRLPEAWSSVQVRHRSDMPSTTGVAEDVLERARARLGSGPAPSGRYALLLDCRAVSRLVGVMLGPLGGTSIFEKRSCMADKLHTKIAASNFQLWDDPLIVRGLSSRPCDGDGLPARRRSIVEDGVLQTFLINVYNSRRLGVPVTTGGTSNMVIPPGPDSPAALAAGAGPTLHVVGFLGGNSNASTGDFSFGVHGALLRPGEAPQPVSEMNVAGNIFELLDRFEAAADDPWKYGSWRCPSLLFRDIQFSGS